MVRAHQHAAGARKGGGCAPAVEALSVATRRSCTGTATTAAGPTRVVKLSD